MVPACANRSPLTHHTGKTTAAGGPIEALPCSDEAIRSRIPPAADG